MDDELYIYSQSCIPHFTCKLQTTDETCHMHGVAIVHDLSRFLDKMIYVYLRIYIHRQVPWMEKYCGRGDITYKEYNITDHHRSEASLKSMYKYHIITDHHLANTIWLV